jgi:hypothetical protein
MKMRKDDFVNKATEVLGECRSGPVEDISPTRSAKLLARALEDAYRSGMEEGRAKEFPEVGIGHNATPHMNFMVGEDHQRSRVKLMLQTGPRAMVFPLPPADALKLAERIQESSRKVIAGEKKIITFPERTIQ